MYFLYTILQRHARIILVASVGLAAGAFAQPLNWSQADGIYGGRIFLLAEAPGGILFAGAEHNGLKRSTDDGATWHSTSLTSQTLRQLTAGPDGTLYVSEYNGGIFMSIDSGRVWTSITGSPSAAYAVECIAVTAAGDLLAGSFYYGVYRTRNRGTTWEHFPLSFSYWPTPVRCLGAPWPNVLFFYADEDGLFRSRDDGATWELAYLPSDKITSIVRLPDDRLMATGNVSTHFSSDSGTTWTSVPNGTGTWFERVAWDGTTRLLAASPVAPIYSTNLGTTWRSFTTPSRAARSMSTLITSSGSFFVGSDGDGVWRSTDEGNSWSQTSISVGGGTLRTILRTPSGRLLLLGGSGPYVSDDDGSTWKPLRTAPITDYGIVGKDNSIILAILDRIERSTDGGTTFETVLTTGDGSGITAFCRDSSGVLYGATYNGLHISRDDGATWAMQPAPFPRWIWRLIATRDRICAASYGSGILGSDDGGKTWIELNRGLPYLNVYSLAIASNGDLYAGTANGKVARLLRGASIWEERTPLTNGLWEIVVDAYDRMFAATSQGVWSTDDLAQTWIDRSEGLSRLRVYGLAFNRQGELVAALPNGGVMVARSMPAPREVERTTMLRTYPNPFNHRTIVQVSVASSVNLTVRLFDLLGRPVTTVYDGPAAPGELLIPVNGTTLATGMYFVVVEGPGLRDIQKILLLR